jgi:hypothetical protein
MLELVHAPLLAPPLLTHLKLALLLLDLAQTTL